MLNMLEMTNTRTESAASVSKTSVKPESLLETVDQHAAVTNSIIVEEFTSNFTFKLGFPQYG
jgi:hypothetical protein